MNPLQAANKASSNPITNIKEKLSPKNSKLQKPGLKITRFFTKEGEKPLEHIEYAKRHCAIKSPTGETIFEMRDCDIPASWSQVASDVMISKYFRKAGVPQYDENEQAITDEKGNPVLGPERSAKHVVERLTGCWRHWGEQYNYFDTEEDAANFEAELQYMLIRQMAAPNSPQWFNTGLQWKYGITGPAQGHHYVDPDTEELKKSTDAYTRPQPHACFIQAVGDDLVNEGGIMDLWIREARLFKYGSGTGSNFSQIRGSGEPLSGGGFSSGLMSFLKIGDSAAGAIKSGGTTRRAAKMVCLDLDHPDIETFINWKKEEEKKVAALIAAGYDSDFNGEAYATVAGQNSNNSVRIPHEFMQAVEKDGNWNLKWRTNGQTCKTLKANDLWNQIAEAAWACADPGVQYDGTINEWHTCPQSGRINASNPCSEYMFLDNTACNLASLNLLHYFDKDSKQFDVKALKHAIRLWTIVLEISVLMAQFPSKEIAQLSYEFRTLGLGYANLGTTLMISGIPYDSEEGRAIAGAITAILTGESYAASAEMAGILGTFKHYEKNKEDMLRVMRNHRRAAYNTPRSEYEGLTVFPMGIDEEVSPNYLTTAAREAWDKALVQGEKFGYRNAQSTVIAPTGTIGLLMDCDTTGVEPDFALVKFKKLAGGGYFKIINQSVQPALKNLGYTDNQQREILTYILGTLSLHNESAINYKSLREKGISEDAISNIESTLNGAFSIGDAFKPWVVGKEEMQRLGFSEQQTSNPNFNLLKELGFNNEDIKEANYVVCGNMTIEGAPHIKDEHLQVFDCANKCGDNGKRYIHHMGHIRMMAAAQSFISGAISKTINMPNEATIEEIKEAYLESWKLGVKANALYRDGSKLSQPLNTSNNDETVEEVSQELKTAQEQIKKLEAKLHASGRKKLPVKRNGITIESTVGGQKLYVRTGEYNNGEVGEVFIDMFKEGASYRSLLNSLAVAVSIGLQYGVPLDKFVEKFTFTRFEPAGITNHPNVRTSTSILDFVFRVLGMEYLNRKDFVQVKPETTRIDEISNNGNKTKTKSEQKQSTQTPKAKIQAAIAAEEQTISKDDGKTVNDQHLKNMMGDAPACSTCGHITVRNGSCYKCLNCGNSEGCS
jgi:ribonucleoside-diphosphate reductase alpha chain